MKARRDTSAQGNIQNVCDCSKRVKQRSHRTKDQAKDCLRLYGQVIKRIWWMPRRQEAMKDVVVCEMLRGVGKLALIRRCPNGETHRFAVSIAEFIGYGS